MRRAHDGTGDWLRAKRDSLPRSERGAWGVRRSTPQLDEEAPGAYKDVTEVVDATEKAGLARKVAKLVPIITVKG